MGKGSSDAVVIDNNQELGTGMRSIAGYSLCCLLFASAVYADDGSEVAEAQSRLKVAQSVKALGTDLFGDSTNFLDGKTTFTATDIDLPGNNALPVRLTRTYVATDPAYDNSVGAGAWEIEVPFVSAVFPTGYNWKGTGSSPYNRCTGMGALPTVNGFTPLVWKRANFIHVPGMGDQSMSSNLTVSNGQTSVPVTSKYWQMSCGVQLANAGSNDFAGEGFVYISADGTKYTFNWMTSRAIQPVKRVTPPAQGQTQNGSVALVRNEIRLLATRVEDRFGNYVTYTYSGSQLTQISASDGRTITLNYNGSNQLTSAVAAGKTWQYSLGSTSTVTLPDGTSWQYTFPRSFAILYGFPPQYLAATCNRPASWNPSSQTQTIHIVHPSGAVGDFTMLLTRHGRTYVNNTCDTDENQNPYGNKLYLPPEFTDNFALSQKQISGPGLTTQTWSVAYAAAAGSTLNDNSGPDTTTVTVTNPDSSKTAYTFGIHYQYNEGKLLETQTLNPSGTVLRDVLNTYALNPSNPPYTYDIGIYGDNFAERFVTPQTQSKITQDGSTYTSTVNSFDNMARALSTTRSGPSGSRTDTTTYYDNTSKWVFGQIQSQTNTDTNTVVSSTAFDPTTVKPASTYAYGLLQRSVTYNADGTVATIANGLNQTTTLSNWKRGAPQNITFPDNSTQSAVINDDGTVASTTDELNSTTTYGYDGAGRMTSLQWPTGDTVNWAPKAFSYTVLSTSELGIPAGSWCLRLNEGAHQKSIYYDARLNPVLEEEKDTSLNLMNYVRHGYDTMGRKVFDSYPSTSYSATAGINTSYDYLGRVVSTQTTDGVTLSQTAYLSGNQLQVTDATGNVTTTSFQAFDKPAYDKPLTITAPQSQTTTYSRNVFGEVLSATRSGGGSSLTETNVYDSYHRLCKVVRPESGQHVVAFDAASEMTWSASGTDVGTTSSTSCDYSSVTAAQKTGYSYDSRGRKTLIDYADASGDVTLGYDAAGHLTSVTNPTATWTYSWNKRGLLQTEQLSMDSTTWNSSYAYDSLGNLSARTYPDNLRIAYSPDAWGRPTRMDATCCGNGYVVGTFASNIQYFANGVASSYSLGSGSTYTAALDARQRLQSQVVSNPGTLQSLSYSYNDNNQLTQITDNLDGSDTASYGYDGLHRLTTANGLWGSYTYGYDAIGNLKTRSGTNALVYNYDGANRLATVTGGASRTYGYDGRGRVTGDGRFGYSWNQADQITNAPGAASYSYDGNGKRVKAVKADGTVEYTLYDANGTMAYVDTPASGNHWAYLSIDGRTSVKVVNGTPTYLYSDKLGSPRLATNNAGAVAWREHYEPYGKRMNGVTDKVGYTGHAYDPETALTYMQARYYDADVGRFLMTDPIGSKDDLNLYAYVGGNPTNATDPTGTSCAGSLLGDCDSGGTSAANVASLSNPAYSGTLDASNKQSAAGIAATAAANSAKSNSGLSQMAASAYDGLMQSVSNPNSTPQRSAASTAQTTTLPDLMPSTFYNHFLFGSGSTVVLSAQQFSEVNNSGHTIAASTNKDGSGYALLKSYYGTPLRWTFGSATLYLDSSYKAVGFHDTYDFDMHSRSTFAAQFMTGVGALGYPLGGKDFEIVYP